MHPLFDLQTWDALSSPQRDDMARSVAPTLTHDFTYEGLRRHSLGGQSHEIAFFTYRRDGVEFALLPGGQVTLGYDPAHPFLPSEHQREEWSYTYDNWGKVALEKELEMSMSPLRQVKINPFLLEVRAVIREDYMEELNDEEVWDNQKVVPRICDGGFRLPTTDEWEYACAAGTRTLFRWGNETPLVLWYSVKGWDQHRLPNAFGLVMNDDTYRLEVCEGGIYRGGDGGIACCGGYGILATWLSLASAYTCPIQEYDFDIEPENELWRRVYPIQA